MNSMIYKRKTPLLLFLAPAFLFLIVYLYYPFFQNIVNTVMKIGGLGRAAEGVNEPWYENYRRLFTDPYVYFFPIVISATALGLMFNLIFLYKGGMVNQLLLSLGRLPYEVKPSGKVIVQWLDWKDQAHFLFTMFLPVMWQYVGFYFVILVTGLNNISPELYEAAALDGADGWRRTRFITLPLLRNVLCTCLVLAITGALKVFDLPWVMFGAGMPENMGWLTGTYMYDQTFNKMNVDYGSTIAVLIVVLGVVLSNVANRVFRPSEDI